MVPILNFLHQYIPICIQLIIILLSPVFPGSQAQSPLVYLKMGNIPKPKPKTNDYIYFRAKVSGHDHCGCSPKLNQVLH